MYGYNTCPRCGSVLDHQSDFDDELEEYTCSACQCLLHRDSVYEDFEISEYDTASAIGAGIALIFGAGALFGALLNKKTSKEEEELLEKEKRILKQQEQVYKQQQQVYKQQQQIYRQQQLNKQRAEMKRQQPTMQKQTIPNSNNNKTKSSSSLSSVLIYIIIIIVAVVFFSFVGKETYERLKPLSVGVNSDELIGRNYEDVVRQFENAGFSNISVKDVEDLTINEKTIENTVKEVYVSGERSFSSYSKYKRDCPVTIYYHTLKRIKVSIASNDAGKLHYTDLEAQLKNAGFVNITIIPHDDLITGWLTKEGTVESITIDGDNSFDSNSTYRPDVNIVITYHSFS